ncbi:MFS transporter [Haloplanus aerogenes]|uniref:MFS transporter n=1 Tax=Haloplanus aerogenes TaxID=660522 RepID=A0A3M0CZ78_9EURY|nr:MFS transporter [Haloplanus aerogenes]AZH26652.1 MFS transporter [Haloplanus aerogenes]RMB12889.1 putative MFS family arabinose efflux permease [Haloplanus aerogenes]
MALPGGATATVEHPRRAVATVVFVVFLDLVGFGIVIPILPYYVRSFGVGDVFIGLLAATYSLMQFLAAPTLGRASDRWGRRPVVTLSLAGSAVAWVVFGLGDVAGEAAGPAIGIAVLFAARALAGAMGGNIAAAQAYVADVTAPEDRAGALGLVGASFSLGFIFGPAMGGALASETAVRAAAGLPIPATRFSLPAFGAAAMSLVALGVALVALEEPARHRTSGVRSTLVGDFVTALRDPALRGLVLAFFLVSVAFAGVQVMFIPFVADASAYGFDASAAALLLTYVGVLGAVNQGLLVGRLADRFGSGRLAVAGATILFVALAALPFAPALGELVPAVTGPAWLTPELVALLAVLGLLSFGNGLLNPSLATLVSSNTGADRQGTAFGVTQGAGSLGRTVGPPVAAALYALVYWSPFVAGAVLVLPVIALLVAVARGEEGRPA